MKKLTKKLTFKELKDYIYNVDSFIIPLEHRKGIENFYNSELKRVPGKSKRWYTNRCYDYMRNEVSKRNTVRFCR